MNIKAHIPNFLTCMNLFCGMLGIYLVFQGNIHAGAYCIFLAAGFDFFDGFAARLLKVSSAIGKELDSLADLVTFGVLPSFILFQMVSFQTENSYLPFLTFSVGIFSALRLAKFNIDTRQSDRFIGVPTPANALLLSTLPFLFEKFGSLDQVLNHPIGLLAISIGMSFLLVAELPLIALKFKNLSFKDNVFRFLTLVIGLISVLTLGLAGIPLVIISYILLSLAERMVVRHEV